MSTNTNLSLIPPYFVSEQNRVEPIKDKGKAPEREEDTVQKPEVAYESKANSIFLKKHPSLIEVNNFDLTAKICIAQKRRELSKDGYSQIKLVKEGQSIIAAKIRKKYKVTNRTYIVKRVKNNFRSTINYSVKLSSGKEKVIKVGPLDTREYKNLLEIHNLVDQRKDELFHKYPEGFVETAKGRKIVVFQSFPQSIDNTNVIITDKCENTLLGNRLSYNNELDKQGNIIINFGYSKANVIAQCAAGLNQLIDKKAFSDAEKKSLDELSKINTGFKTHYDDFLKKRAGFDLSVLSSRQEKIITVCKQAVTALAILHFLSYVHNDVKPENIFSNNPDSQLPKAVFGDWEALEGLLDPSVNPRVESASVNKTTLFYISAVNIDRLRESVTSACRLKYNRARQEVDYFGLGSTLYYQLVGIRLPHTYALREISSGHYNACVEPDERAFSDPVFLMLPEAIRSVIKKMILCDKDFTIDEAYEAFKVQK